MTIIILIATALHACTSTLYEEQGWYIECTHLFDTILYQYTYLKWKDYTDTCLSGVSIAS